MEREKRRVLSMFLKVDNVGAERMSSGIDCSRRPDQPLKMPGCRVGEL